MSTIILEYHDLIERDVRYIGACWSWFTFLPLGSIIFCSMGFIISFIGLLDHFNGHCISNSKLVFLKDGSSSFMYRPHNKNAYSDKWFEDYPSKSQATSERSLNISIDYMRSSWGNPSTCQKIEFTSAMELFGSFTWYGIVLLIGYRATNIDSKPWRIVTPSIVFFGVIIIISLTHLIYVHKYLKNFCHELQTFLPHGQLYTCEYAYKYFQATSDVALSAKLNYRLCYIFDSLILVISTIGFTIMIIRCIYVIDFQLIRVIMSTVNQETVQQNIRFVDKNGIGELVKFKINEEDN